MGIHRMIVYPLLLCFVASLNLQPNETGKREMRRMIGTKTYWAEIDGENMVFCSHMVLYGKNSEPIPQLTKPQCQKGLRNTKKRNRLWKRKWSHKKFFEFAL